MMFLEFFKGDGMQVKSDGLKVFALI